MGSLMGFAWAGLLATHATTGNRKEDPLIRIGMHGVPMRSVVQTDLGREKIQGSSGTYKVHEDVCPIYRAAADYLCSSRMCRRFRVG